MKRCPRCDKRPAIKDTILGYIECEECQSESNSIKPEVEFTTDSIKEQRREFRKSITQPWRDGCLSKEFIEAYGTKRVTATKEEIKNAKYTWKDTSGWWNRDKTQ